MENLDDRFGLDAKSSIELMDNKIGKTTRLNSTRALNGRGTIKKNTFSLSPLARSISFLGTSVIIILLIIIDVNENTKVHSLNCYHCSSLDNPECGETLTGSANLTETDCTKHISQPVKVCRKIVQYIEDKKVVIRSCGHIDSNEDIEKKSQCHKRSGTYAILMESCTCYTDKCNSSANLVPDQFVFMLASLSTLLASVMILSSANRSIRQTS